MTDTDYYGSSYLASPSGQLIDGGASDTEDELSVRDLDMSLIEEVRRHWAFYRDRRPDMYGDIPQT